MAYDKPLKMQWIEVDGRTVPLVLPQYWSEEQNDWVVSSTQNRLPVDAQLTGSIVLLSRRLSGTVAAQSKTYVLTTQELYNYSRLFVVVSSDIVHDFDVAITYRVSEYEVGATVPIYEWFKDDFVVTLESATEKVKATTRHLPVLGDSASVRVFNNSEEDRLYDIHVWGVK